MKTAAIFVLCLLLGIPTSVRANETIDRKTLKEVLGSFHEIEWPKEFQSPKVKAKINQAIREVIDQPGSRSVDGLITRRAVGEFGFFVRVAQDGSIDPSDQSYLEDLVHRAKNGEFGRNSLLFVADSIAKIPTDKRKDLLRKIYTSLQTASEKKYVRKIWAKARQIEKRSETINLESSPQARSIASVSQNSRQDEKVRIAEETSRTSIGLILGSWVVVIGGFSIQRSNRA